MSLRMAKRFRYHGHIYTTGPRANLVDHCECVRSSIHRLGGTLLMPVTVHRLGVYHGGDV